MRWGTFSRKNPEIGDPFLPISPHLSHLPPSKLPDNIRSVKLCHNQEIQRITGKSEKAGYRMLGAIRKKLGKQPHQYVIINEFAEFAGIALEDVSHYIKD